MWPSFYPPLCYINLNMHDSSSLKDIFLLLVNSFPCHPVSFSFLFKPFLLQCKMSIAHTKSIFLSPPFSRPFHRLCHFYTVLFLHDFVEELFCMWNLLLASRKEYEPTNHLCSHNANSCVLNPMHFNRNSLDNVLNGSCISRDGEHWSRRDLQLRKSLPYCWEWRWHTRGNITLSAFSISAIPPWAYQSLTRTGCWGKWLFDTTP